MNNKDQVRKENLRNRYLEKIRSIESTSTNEGLEENVLITDNGSQDDYSDLLSNLYGGDSDAWSASLVSSTYSAGYGGTQNPSSAIDVRVNSGVTAQKLNSKLGGKLAGKGSVFIEAGNKYGIDPAFLAAVSMHETGNGTSNAIQTRNNVGGMMQRNTQTGAYNVLRTFNTVDEGIDAMASNLKRLYIDEGLVSIESIQKKYAPVGAANDPKGQNNNWISGVTKYLNSLGVGITTPVNGSFNYQITEEERKTLLKSINVDTSQYLKTGKIPIPVGDRNIYAKSMIKYIETSGGITSSAFDSLMIGDRKNKFIDKATNSKNPHAMRLRKDMLYYLEMLHAKASKELGVSALQISSAYRSPAYNKSIGGATNSAHMTGCAVDITFGQNYRHAVAVANIAYGMGFGGIAIGKQNNYFLHLDIGPYGRWDYNKNPKYKKVGKYESPIKTGQ